MHPGIPAALEKLRRNLAAGPVVMGIVNVTPDSFSDGGLFASRDAALAHCAALTAEGAHILDIGGESTRPGHVPVTEAEELARVLPVLEALASVNGPLISIDTSKAGVARRAMTLGASIVNDVWGLQKDAGMANAVAEGGAAAVLMHNRMTKDESIDIVADMRAFFDVSLGLARRAGIADKRLMIDPGIGFGKTKAQNMRAFRAIRELRAAYGLPVLIGVSRKSFLLNFSAPSPAARLGAGIAASIAAAALGASVFRVHDVAAHVAALSADAAFRRGALA